VIAARSQFICSNSLKAGFPIGVHWPSKWLEQRVRCLYEFLTGGRQPSCPVSEEQSEESCKESSDRTCRHVEEKIFTTLFARVMDRAHQEKTKRDCGVVASAGNCTTRIDGSHQSYCYCHQYEYGILEVHMQSRFFYLHNYWEEQNAAVEFRKPGGSRIGCSKIRAQLRIIRGLRILVS